MTLSTHYRTLRSILQRGAIATLFQPIHSTDGRDIIGYEALSRGPSNSPLHSPIMLFAAARQCDRLMELDMLCRGLAIERFAASRLPGKLFLNVLPETLLDQRHAPGRTRQMLERAELDAERVVIELTEQSPIDDYDLLRRALRYYRNMGFSIALDDLGAGYSGLRLWTEMMPDFVKVDRHFIDGIHTDQLKQEFLDSMLRMSCASGATLVAEGVELDEELQVLKGLGAPMVQGFLLGRPQPYSIPLADQAMAVTHSYCG